jgi:hypothetical protein
MTERKAETIDIGKGVKYAKVASRSAEFHKDNEKCDVETTCDLKDDHVLFSARVTTRKGTFTGHSLAKIGGRQKQFEKQETIAVGRALAFAGYLADGEIACAEEMADLVTQSQLNSLKLKYAKVNESELDGCDRVAKQEAFSAWCREIIGEDASYNDPVSWCREWYDAAWKSLQSGSDVPFEE